MTFTVTAVRRLVCLLSFCIVVCAGVNFCPAQANKNKGWAIDLESDWINSKVGYQRYHVKITTNSGLPVKDDSVFHLVGKEHQGNSENLLVSKSIVIEAGKASVESDFFIHKTNSSYNDYIHFHIEQDGNLNYDQRDLVLEYTYVGGYGYQSSGLPPLLLVSSAVIQNKTKKHVRTPRKLMTVGEQQLSVDESKMPSIGELAAYYPTSDGNQSQINRAGTPIDTLASNIVHAIPPTDLPTSWSGLTSAEVILISISDFAIVADDPRQFEAVRGWTSAGGSLIVFDCGKSYEKAALVRELLYGKRPSSNLPPWKFPGGNLSKLTGLIVSADDTNNYYADESDPKFVNLSTARSNRVQKDWTVVADDDDLAAEIGKSEHDFAMHRYNLGRVVVVGSKMDKWPFSKWKNLLNAVSIEGRSIHQRLGGTTSGSQPIDGFAIAGAGKPPIREFQFLIGFFVLLIGPISYIVLRKQRRLQLLFLTVPLISAIACSGLLLYAILSDGFSNRGRTRSFTEIDHAYARAVTYTRHSQYAGVQPDNYVFDKDDMVFNGRGWTSPRSITQVDDNKRLLNGGDIRPRMPHQISTVKSYETTKGLNILIKKNSTIPLVENRFIDSVRLAVIRTKDGFFSVENLQPGNTVAANKIDNTKQFRKKLARLIDETSPEVTDEFFKLSSYNYNPYGWNSQTSSEKFEADRQFSNARKAITVTLAKDNQYLAVLENFDEVAEPQPNIEYIDKLNLVHGKW